MMKRPMAMAAVLAVLALGGCTTTSTIRLAPDRAMITTRGNAFTPPEMVMRDLLLQAAGQAKAAGYEWFLVQSSQDVTQHGVAFLPAQGSASASGNAYGWSGSSSYTGASYLPYTKPGAMVLVLFGSGPKPPKAFVAADIIAMNQPKK